MDTTLSDQEMTELRKALQERAQALRSQVVQELLASGKERYVELAGLVHDRGDESVADLLADINLTIMDRHAGEMRDIDTALTRMNEGVYGICVDCHDTVPYGRLQAYPTAKRCYRCQVRHEKDYAQPRHPAL